MSVKDISGPVIHCNRSPERVFVRELMSRAINAGMQIDDMTLQRNKCGDDIIWLARFLEAHAWQDKIDDIFVQVVRHPLIDLAPYRIIQIGLSAHIIEVANRLEAICETGVAIDEYISLRSFCLGVSINAGRLLPAEP